MSKSARRLHGRGSSGAQHCGALRLPGDKSISHRYAMLGAIAEGTTRLENFSTGADCASTLSCLAALGVEVERTENAVLIHGRGPKLQPPKIAARLRQFRVDHAHAKRNSCGAEVSAAN